MLKFPTYFSYNLNGILCTNPFKKDRRFKKNGRCGHRLSSEGAFFLNLDFSADTRKSSQYPTVTSILHLRHSYIFFILCILLYIFCLKIYKFPLVNVSGDRWKKQPKSRHCLYSTFLIWWILCNIAVFFL